MRNEKKLYSISSLQKAFEQMTHKTEYFYVEAGGIPMYADKPFRTDTYTILLLKSGSIRVHADLMAFTITGPVVLTIGPNVTRSFQKCNDEHAVTILFFTDTFLLKTRANIFYLNNYRFFEENARHSLTLYNSEMERLTAVFALIASTYHKGHFNEQLLMRSYTYLLIHEIDAMHKERSTNIERYEDYSSVSLKFRNLLTKEFLRHRSVSFYAEKLNLRPKYLSALVKKETGKTAGDWIDRAIVLEAKVLLQNKDPSIAQISDRLSFCFWKIFALWLPSVIRQ